MTQDSEVQELIDHNPELEKRIAEGVYDRGRWFRRVVIGWIIAFTATVFGLYEANKSRAHENSKAVTALCAQRHDLDLRIAATEALLEEHKKDKIIFAIPKTLFKTGLDRDRATRQNLEILEYKGGGR